jgi:hypothetical protein
MRAFRAVLEKQPELTADASSLPLEAQMAHLRRQYDELLASKLQLSEKYGRDLANWKSFKEQFRTTSGGKGIIMSEDGIKTRRRVLRQAKDSPTPAKRISYAQPIPLATDDDVFIKTENSLPRNSQHNPMHGNSSLSVSNTDTQNSQSLSPVEQTSGQRAKGKAIASDGNKYLLEVSLFRKSTSNKIR